MAQIEWEQSEVTAWRPPSVRFDAIVTHFFLDCFPPARLADVIGKLATCATPDAVWLVTDFALPARGLRRRRARAVHALMYAFFRVAVRLPARRLTPPDALLAQHGFRREHRAEFDWGLVQADVWRRRR